MNIPEHVLVRLDALMSRWEATLPPIPKSPDWGSSIAFRWRREGQQKWLEAIPRIGYIALQDILHVDRQKELLVQNTRQFLAGLPANHVLLTGARGAGKSSLIRACLHAFSDQGLRIIEVSKDDLIDLFDISACIANRPERFILYCDDLSFDEGDSSYKVLKAALDGSIAVAPDNLLIYATSNRRHLMPEYQSDNRAYRMGEDGEIHPGETVEEKISFSDRFGLWLSFYAFSQEDYLEIVRYWLFKLGCPPEFIEEARTEALQWAMQRGTRSGRTAWQFARDFAGRKVLSSR